MSYSKILAIFLIFSILQSCSKGEIDPITGKKKRYEPNVTKKVQASDGLIFGGKNKGGGTTYDFATSNVLWRASLDVISFMPLSNVSYSGGLITTDWYSSKDSKEMIKINIRFLSDQLQTSSLIVSGFKKKCDAKDNCVTTPTTDTINTPIKSKIIERARELSLKDEKNKKK